MFNIIWWISWKKKQILHDTNWYCDVMASYCIRYKKLRYSQMNQSNFVLQALNYVVQNLFTETDSFMVASLNAVLCPYLQCLFRFYVQFLLVGLSIDTQKAYHDISIFLHCIVMRIDTYHLSFNFFYRVI
jgi:hypothetical protein